MTTIESLSDISGITREAVVDLLYRMGDDELIIGQRDSEWTEPAPVLDENTPFSSMARDEMGHARMFYQMLHELGEPEPNALAISRKPRQFRCASFVCVPRNHDWASCLIWQFLYDSAETVRLTALTKSALVPLAQLATKLIHEEEHHLMHGRSWVLRYGRAADDSRERMQAALATAYPHALGLFEPTEADETLAHAGICPREEELCRQWESAVAPVLADANLVQPDSAEPVYGGRFGKHPEALAELLNGMHVAFNIDPTAKS